MYCSQVAVPKDPQSYRKVDVARLCDDRFDLSYYTLIIDIIACECLTVFLCNFNLIKPNAYFRNQNLEEYSKECEIGPFVDIFVFLFMMMGV